MADAKGQPIACDVIRAGVDGGPVSSSTGMLSTPAVTELDRWLLRQLAWINGSPPVTFCLWNGERVHSPPSPAGRVTFMDRGVIINTLLDPEIGFGDGYTAGRIEIHGDLVNVLHRACVAVTDNRWNQLKHRLYAWLPKPQRNSEADARKNIHYHYDIGNEFYRLWLDEHMVYTCAYYAERDMTLEQAQAAKLDHVCRKLGLKTGMQVFEAGCGWGALALHMARHYGVRVRAWNISREQIQYAREQAATEGLANRVEFIQDDYRAIGGRCDAFVSVGMLEHVGRDNYASLGSVIDRCLKPGGRGLIHSIGRNRPMPMNAWTDRRIFPGSYVPALREMLRIMEPAGLSVLDVENLRLHYASTLLDWLKRFEDRRDQIRDLYDDSFVRGWRLYLATSAAAFLAGNLQLFQVVFARSADNDIPMTRAHLYRDG